MVAHLLLVNGTKGAYAEALLGAGYRVTTVETMKEALFTRRRPDAVIVELVVPEGGLEDIRRALHGRRRTRAMTVIALADAAHQEAVVSAGAAFCPQPCPPADLVGLVRETLAKRSQLTRVHGPQGSKRPV